MIATTILALIVTFSAQIYLNFFGSVRNLKAANLVYEEARFTMERIVKEVRNGTIDYEEYYNQNLVKGRTGGSYDYILNDTYTQDYCQYSRQFYSSGPDGEIGTLDDESTGVRLQTDETTGNPVPPAIGRLDGLDYVPDPIQNDLYLINVNGDRRSFIKRIEKFDSQGISIGKIGLLKLTGKDFGVDHINALDPNLDSDSSDACTADAGENDGRIDTWLCEDGYECDEIFLTSSDCTAGDTVAGHTIFGQNIFIDPSIPSKSSFVDITPTSLDIVDLKFIISPMDDPRKAYNDNSVQVQPHVTIKMIARANPKLAAQFKSDRTPDIVLESTVSTRAQNPIITECNLRQCTDFSTPKACPLSAGVCGPQTPGDDPATQECVSFVWSGCSTDDYTNYADDEWGSSTFGDGNSYQAGSEFASCGGKTGTDYTSCVSGFCNDDMDNDCDGLTDEMDPECRFFLCNDGIYNEDVEGIDGCKDVGGLCQTIRPLEPTETSCYDGYDNDCDYEVIDTVWTEGTGADQFDSDCIAQFCSNGEMDPDERTVPNNDEEPYYFLRLNYDEKDYLLNAKNSDTDDSLDETCIDVGPLCPTNIPSADETASCDGDINCERIVCSDGYDNDCNGQADELDDDCTSVICNDTKRNCDLIDTSYDFAGDPNISEDYLKNYFNLDCDDTDLDELCKNVGGVCDGFMDFDALTYFDHTKLNSENAPVSASAINPLDEEDLCKDGLDNDCDGNIDWRDADCCPDLDNDGYVGEKLGIGTNFCDIELAFNEGALIDCNDDDPDIKPGVAEVCDDAVYPVGHDLAGDPIDNNCSLANGLTDLAWDNNDPACCVDVDGDNYGVADAYLSCDNNSAPDCDDSDASINPSAFESIASGNCFNEDSSSGNDFPLNDNCDYTSDIPHANHLDWYADKDAGWFTWYGSESVENFDTSALSGETGIQAAKILDIYSASCCPSSHVTEICDDNTYGTYGSDENCNGLEGNNDHYCVANDGRAFYEYFTDSSHGLSLDTANGVIQDTDLGIITLTDASDIGNVQSNTLSDLDLTACTNSYQITLNATDTTSGSSDILYQLSPDGGATWCTSVDCSGADWFLSLPASITIDTLADPSATDIMWKARLIGNDPDIPVLSDVTITINNCM